MEELRCAGAALVWLAPGLALTRAFGAARGDALAALALAYAASLAVSTFAAFALHVLGVPATALAGVLPALAAVALLDLAARRGGRDGRDPPPRLAVTAAGFLIAGLLALAGWYGGQSLRLVSDSPDHIGTLREILATGKAFPTEAFHLDAGILGADSRKGLFHPVLAALSRIAGLDPADFWMRGRALAAPLPFLAAYAFLRTARLPSGWALAGGLAVLLTWSGGPAAGQIAVSIYPNQFATAVFWMGAGLGLRAVHRHEPRTAVFGGIVAFGAVAAHPMIVVFLALFYTLLGLFVLVNREPGRRRPFLLQGAVAGVFLLPYLLARLPSYVPANEIHTQLQGMLLLGDRLFVADPIHLARSVGAVGVVAFPLWLLTGWKGMRADPFVWFVWTATLAMAGMTVNPLVVPLLQETITYLVFRAFWFFPAGLVAVFLARRFLGFPSRTAAAAGCVLLGAAFLPAVKTALTPAVFSPRVSHFDALSLRGPLEAVDRALPSRSVVLGDPVTSYLLPAFTTQRTACTLDQHSPPNDARALERILACRRVLSPAVDDSTAWAVARSEGASFVLLNHSLTPPLVTGTWSYEAGAAADRAALLDASPRFERVSGIPSGLSLFRLVENPPAGAPVLSGTARFEAGPHPRTPVAGGGIALRRVSAPLAAAVGEPFPVVLSWTREADSVPIDLRAALRFETGPEPRGFASKIRRRLREVLRNAPRTRYRRDVIPGGGAVPPDLWPPGAAHRDTVRVTLPTAMAPGTYRISVALVRVPHLPNHRPSDYLSDRDVYSGTVVDSIRVSIP